MEIKAPDLGVDSAEVSEIMVEVGDVITKDDNIILIESDKASVEVPSSAAGKVTKINVAVGDQVSEGMVLKIISNSCMWSFKLSSGNGSYPCPSIMARSAYFRASTYV